MDKEIRKYLKVKRPYDKGDHQDVCEAGFNFSNK